MLVLHHRLVRFCTKLGVCRGVLHHRHVLNAGVHELAALNGPQAVRWRHARRGERHIQLRRSWCWLSLMPLSSRRSHLGSGPAYCSMYSSSSACPTLPQVLANDVCDEGDCDVDFIKVHCCSIVPVLCVGKLVRKLRERNGLMDVSCAAHDR